MSDQARDAMEAIDQLLVLQDATAAGNMEAVEEQKRLLLGIGKSLSGLQQNLPPQLAYPVIAYVMSGGDPRVAEQLAKGSSLDPREQSLLHGAAQFMQGDRNAAAAAFTERDPLRLPGRISGRIALAQALLAHDDARQAFYALAISAMPGTLIEESALRRSALAYAEARDEPAFWRRVERYGRRFPVSVYAPGFWADTMAAVVTWAAKQPGPNLQRLDLVLATRPVADRRRLYLALARLSAAASNTGLSVFAAQRLNRLAENGSAEQQLGLFYMTLYEIVSPEGDDALRQLRSLRRDLLGRQEKALLDAALAIGAMIERPEPAIPRAEDATEVEKSPQEERGTTLLAASSQLLGKLN